MQKDVDSGLTLPQYLVSRALLIPEMGGILHSGPEVEKGKSFTEEPHGNEEESQKEKALTTVSETILRKGQRISEASQEKNLLGGFSSRADPGTDLRHIGNSSSHSHPVSQYGSATLA
jgi:hypothetical protein